jgi:hypothetical protein
MAQQEHRQPLVEMARDKARFLRPGTRFARPRDRKRFAARRARITPKVNAAAHSVHLPARLA